MGAVYVENETKLLGPIALGAVFEETRHGKDVTNHTGAIYDGNETELSSPIR